MIIIADYQVLVFPDTEENRDSARIFMGGRSYEFVTELTRPGIIFSFVDDAPKYPNTVVYYITDNVDSAAQPIGAPEFDDFIKPVKWIDSENLKKIILKILNEELEYLDVLRKNGPMSLPMYPIDATTKKYLKVYNLLLE